MFRLFYFNENQISRVSEKLKQVGNFTGTVFNYRVLKCAQHSIKVLLISFIGAIDCETTRAKTRIECFFLPRQKKKISFSRETCMPHLILINICIEKFI